MTKHLKAIGIISGGLDSRLALKIMKLQDIEPIAFHLHSVFFSSAIKRPESISKLEAFCRSLHVQLVVENHDREYLTLVESPAHGYGSQMNPCIDCKIFILQRAKQLMEEHEASFVFSGEVLGQRPMTQNLPTMQRIEQRAGLEGLLLRPLSARLLPPTIPEKKGWVDREQLLDIQGRSRKRQLELARTLGITDFPTPAGGCLLTEPSFARRLRDLFKQGEYELNDIVLLKLGRHLRLSPQTKLIVGRNHQENLQLSELAQNDDLLLQVEEIPGPLALLRGHDRDQWLQLAAQITKHYSDARQLPTARVRIYQPGAESSQYLEIEGSLSPAEFKPKLI